MFLLTISAEMTNKLGQKSFMKNNSDINIKISLWLLGIIIFIGNVQAENIAPLGEAKASSSYSSSLANKVNDNSEVYPDNTWISASNIKPPHWIYIIWTKPYKINKVSIAYYPSYGLQAVDFQIQTLKGKGNPDKDEDWETQIGVTDNTSQITNHKLDDVITQGIRLYITRPTTMSGGDYDMVRIMEMRVDGTTDLTPSGILEKSKMYFEWEGKGEYRLIVGVLPNKLEGNRKFDEMPAKIQIDFQKLFSVSLIPDLSSIQVIRYNSDGKPIKQGAFKGLDVYDIAYRWDDFSHRKTNFYYHRRGNGYIGDMIWNHTQIDDQPSYYAIYLNFVKKGEKTSLGPMPIIGDGDAIYDSDAPIYGGLHLKVEIVDWDNDGLLDLLLGDTPGYLQWYRNIGTKNKPHFEEAIFLNVDGKTFKEPYCPAFCASDWDDDGDLDLIYGKEPGGEVFYIENIGTRAEPYLVSKGRIICDNKPLKTPGNPFFDKSDPSDAWGGSEYMCTPVVVDWDGDGDKDLLLGSYSGGQVYLCDNTRNSKGLPVLTWCGFLKDVDNNIIDSNIAASPEIADFDDDGDLDMILGGADWTSTGGAQPPEISNNLIYYENVGSRNKPKLSRRLFPDKLEGKGIEQVAVPSVGDIDNDGDLDLIISTFNDIQVYTNVGNSKKPYFYSEGQLKAGWNPVKFGAFSCTPFDIDNDGDLDIIASDCGKFRLLEKVDNLNPPKYRDIGFLKFDEKEFRYVFPLGDAELFSSAQDLDKDGRIDLLYGTGEGNVWFCKNMGMKNGKVELAKPRILMLEEGNPVKVGHYKPIEKATNFRTHSGDRADPGIGDFDGDDDMDLMVSDAYGGLTYFENVGGNKNPIFKSGCIIKKEDNIRLLHEVVDWDGDGKPDLILCQSDVLFWKNVSKGNIPEFIQIGGSLTKGQYIPYPNAYALDWNGDGDQDLIVANSYMLIYYFERSYINDTALIFGKILEVGEKKKK